MTPPSRLRSGQAMVETVLAVLIITFAFLALFRLSRLLMGKILLEHAAMRVARARTVGLNEFMCRKAARVAVIPVAGERIWPIGADSLNWSQELARIPDYMFSENEQRARAILEYDGWSRMKIDPGDGRRSRVALAVAAFGDEPTMNLEGEAGIEANATYYMTDMGL